MFCVALLVVAGILWGLYGLFCFNLIDYIFGPCWASRLIYFIIGVVAVYVAFAWKPKLRKK